MLYFFPTLVIASSRSETEKREDAFPASAGALPSSCCSTGNFFDCSGLQQNADSTQIKEASEYQKLSIGRVASSHQNPADHRCKNANHKHELIPKGIDIISLSQRNRSTEHRLPLRIVDGKCTRSKCQRYKKTDPYVSRRVPVHCQEMHNRHTS